MNNNQEELNFTSHAFIWCMNTAFVISMSQLYYYQLIKYLVILLNALGILFLLFHYALARKVQTNIFAFTVIALAIGAISYIFSGGPTILKLILFILGVQTVSEKKALIYYCRSLMFAFLIVFISSVSGITEMIFYSRFKTAYGFGFQNPNTVPVIMFAIMGAINIANEKTLKFRHLVYEMLLVLIFYYFCKSRTFFYIWIFVFAILTLSRHFQDSRFIKALAWPFQFTFLILAIISYYLTVMYRSGNSRWENFDFLLSGRLYAWQHYFNLYGISVFGNKLSTEYYGALDNAYLQLLLKYGVIAFVLYTVIFIYISRYAWKNNRWVLFTIIIATELYFLSEFGSMIVNFCPVILYYGCILNKNKELIREDDDYRGTIITWHGKKLF